MGFNLEPETAAELRRQLVEEGYCRVQGVAPADFIEQMRQAADRIAQAESEEQLKTHRFQGSLIQVMDHPELAPLIGLPSARQAMSHLGFPNPRFLSGYIISKPPVNAPALFWHQDGIGWSDPINYTDAQVQLFLMYYLIDTGRENGCLRVIPGSHRKRHRLHGLPPAHSDALQNFEDGHPALQIDADEVDVPVEAGDLVIGDARLLHSAHANQSGQRRTVITLWFCPIYDDVPGHIQARYGRPRSQPENWPDEAWSQVMPVLAEYVGDAEPLEHNRTPDDRLF